MCRSVVKTGIIVTTHQDFYGVAGGQSTEIDLYDITGLQLVGHLAHHYIPFELDLLDTIFGEAMHFCHYDESGFPI